MENIRTDFDNTLMNKKERYYNITVPTSPNFPEDAIATRYVVKLEEGLYVNDLNNYEVAISGLTRVTTTPQALQFRIVPDTSSQKPHLLEFNVAQAGSSYNVHCYTVGSVLDIDSIVCNSDATQTTRHYIISPRKNIDLNKIISDLDGTNKTIYLKNGTYTISTAIILSNSGLIEITGESREGVIINSTSQAFQMNNQSGIIRNMTINYTGSSLSNDVIIGTSGYLENNRYMLIDNVRIDGNTKARYGIRSVSNVNNVIIEDCYTTAIIDSGYVRNSSFINSVVGMSNVYHIDNCIARSNSSVGISGYYINNCYATLNGIGFSSCSGITMSRSLSNTAYGFQGCYGMQHNRASGNTTQNYNQTTLNYCSWTANATYSINNANGVETPNGGFNL